MSFHCVQSFLRSYLRIFYGVLGEKSKSLFVIKKDIGLLSASLYRYSIMQITSE